MHFKQLSLAAALVASALAQGQTLSEVIAGNENLSALAAYLNQYPDLVSQLEQAGNITLLAPSNEAIQKLLEATGQEPPPSGEEPPPEDSEDPPPEEEAPPPEETGEPAERRRLRQRASKRQDEETPEDTPTEEPPTEESPSPEGDPEEETAPAEDTPPEDSDPTDADGEEGSDAGTQQDIQALLTYHVLSGEYRSDAITEEPQFVPTLLEDPQYTGVTGGQVVEIALDGENVKVISGLLTTSSVSEADIEFNGGVIHIIDTVLTIPESVADTAAAADLTAFLGAAITAGLDQQEEPSDATYFIPNNEAFEGIGSELENISPEDLAALLSYHVAASSDIGYSSSLEDGATLQTAAGSEVTISIVGEDIFVNAAKVVTPNILVGTGVVHIIDQVLNPEDTDPPAEGATEGEPAFEGASSVESLAFTSNVPEPSTTIAATTTEEAGSAETTSSSELAPAMTGAVGAAALFGAGAALLNL